jgi:hypothetical protein
MIFTIFAVQKFNKKLTIKDTRHEKNISTIGTQEKK